MIECCGGSLILTYQQDPGARPNDPVWVDIDAEFADRVLNYRVLATSDVEEDLTAIVCRLQRIESCVVRARSGRLDDLESRTYPTLGISLRVRHLARYGCELELTFRDPGSQRRLSVVNRVPANRIDDFVQGVWEGVDPSNHPRVRFAARLPDAEEGGRPSASVACPAVGVFGF